MGGASSSTSTSASSPSGLSGRAASSSGELRPPDTEGNCSKGSRKAGGSRGQMTEKQKAVLERLRGRALRPPAPAGTGTQDDASSAADAGDAATPTVVASTAPGSVAATSPGATVPSPVHSAIPGVAVSSLTPDAVNKLMALGMFSATTRSPNLLAQTAGDGAARLPMRVALEAADGVARQQIPFGLAVGNGLVRPPVPFAPAGGSGFLQDTLNRLQGAAPGQMASMAAMVAAAAATANRGPAVAASTAAAAAGAPVGQEMVTMLDPPLEAVGPEDAVGCNMSTW